MSTRYNAAIFKALIAEGRNIVEWVRSQENTVINSSTALLYGYDAQAGSYVSALENPDYRQLKDEQAVKLAAILDGLVPSSILDAGTGEATTFAPTLNSMRAPPEWRLGFDISMSRLLHARKFLASQNITNVSLFAAQLDHIPLADDSVDVVTTFHSIEPNHGREETILAELLRVTARHLVLIEPSWELGSAEARLRMEQHGYARGIPAIIEKLGHKIVRHEPWCLDVNPLNSAALTIVSKNADRPHKRPTFVSPISRTLLTERHDSFYCAEDGHAFPLISGLPCFLTSSAILVSHLDQF